MRDVETVGGTEEQIDQGGADGGVGVGTGPMEHAGAGAVEGVRRETGGLREETERGTREQQASGKLAASDCRGMDLSLSGGGGGLCTDNQVFGDV